MREPTANQIDSWFSGIKEPLNQYEGRELTHDDLVSIVVLMAKAVGNADTVSVAAVNALEHLEGRSVSRSMLNRNVRRVLANWHFIAEGMDIPDWDGTTVTTDVVVIGVRSAGINNGKRQYLLSLKLKTGIVAGIVNCAVESEYRISDFLDHEAGVAKYNCSPEEIAGMRARITVTQPNDMLKVLSWSASQAQKKLNKELAEARADVTKCRNGVQPCNTCRCTVRECPLAVWLEGENDNGKMDVHENKEAR